MKELKLYSIMLIVLISLLPIMGVDSAVVSGLNAADKPSGKLGWGLYEELERYMIMAPAERPEGRMVVKLKEAVSQAILDQFNEMGYAVEGAVENIVQIRGPLDERKVGEIEKWDIVAMIHLPPDWHSAWADRGGVDLIGVSEMHRMGYRGQGVKVAVLDTGFNPANPEVQESNPHYYRVIATGLFTYEVIEGPVGHDNTDTSSKHGTAVAEIVAHVAPEADLYLISFVTLLDYYFALEFAVEKLKVDIVVVAGFWDIPSDNFDGTSLLARKADWVVDHGVVFVASAGNLAQNHYAGAYQDLDGDQWHDFGNGDQRLRLELRKDNTIFIILTWNNWGCAQDNSCQDLDLILFDSYGSVVGVSGTDQCIPGVQPWERIKVTAGYTGTYYLYVVKARDCSGSESPVQMHIFTSDLVHFEEHIISRNSIPSTIASANKVLTIGAVDPETLQVRPYSARGPTGDGRVKPEIVAPDGVPSLEYGHSFLGTSASAPHVAGAIALLLSKAAGLTPEEIRRILLDTAIDLGEHGPDNTSGYGLIDILAAARAID